MNHSLLRRLSVRLALLVFGLVATTPLRGAEANLLPVIEPLSDISLTPSGTADVAVTATDPDGEPLVFSLMFGPSYASLQIVDDNHATIHIGPAPAIAECWTVSVQAADPSGASDTRSFRVWVNLGDGSPIADAGLPHSTRYQTAIQFSGSNSTDPEGQQLTYAWDFGDGTTASDPNPVHTYGRTGLFTVTLTVTDPDGRVGTAHTWAFQYGFFRISARAFVLPPDDRIRAGRPRFRVYIEMLGGQPSLEQIIPESVYLYTQGTTIPAISTKRSAIGDVDGNGVPDYAAYFDSDALWAALTSLPSGRSVVPMIVAGQTRLASGDLNVNADFEASFATLVIKGNGQRASVAPGIRNSSELVLRLERNGPLSAETFDVRGRLVRTVHLGATSAGERRIQLLGPTGAAGIYFYRLRTADGEARGRFMVLK